MSLPQNTVQDFDAAETPRVSTSAGGNLGTADPISASDEPDEGVDALVHALSTRRAEPFCIRKSQFKLLVNEIVKQMASDKKFTNAAMKALQEAAEAHVTQTLHAASLVAAAEHRTTIELQDLDMSAPSTGTGDGANTEGQDAETGGLDTEIDGQGIEIVGQDAELG